MDFKLIVKKIENTLTSEEEKEFLDWYQASARHRQYFDKVEENLYHGRITVNKEKAWETINRRPEYNSKKRRRYLRYVSAVAVVLLVALGIITYRSTGERAEVKVADIRPGTSRAILTLENGNKVALREGEAFATGKATSNGRQLVYTADTGSRDRYNALEVPRGGEFVLRLPDSSRIWINAGSKIKYPVAFLPGETRTVELLYGEAYFQITPAAKHEGSAFVVKTGSQEIEVLGTEFNIRAYPEDGDITSTLVEGKVALSGRTSRELLIPGEQVVYTEQDGTMKKKRVNTEDYTSWRAGVFRFRDITLEEMALTLSRWYDVKVSFTDDALRTMKFNGSFSRELGLRKILDVLSASSNVTYKIDENEVKLK